MVLLLVAATIRAKPEVVDLLLRSGADPLLKTTHGRTAFDRASDAEIRQVFLNWNLKKVLLYELLFPLILDFNQE